MNKIQYLITIFSLLWGGIVYAKDIQLTPENYKKNWNSIQPGDKVTLSSGEYRADLLLLANKPWSVDAPTIFIAETAGKAIIKGSDEVKGWRKLEENKYVKDWSTEAEQVFVDGKALKQLGGTVFGGFPNNHATEFQKMHLENGGIWVGRVNYAAGTLMPENSFYYDNANKKLIIKVSKDPNQSKTEVSVRRRPFYAEGVSGIVLDGLVFEHSNTSFWGRGGAVTIIGNDNIIRNVTVKNMDSIGIQMVGDRNQLIETNALHNGQLGVAMRGSNNLIKGVEASYNNTRGFNKWWEAGGFKFVGNGGLQNSEVINNIAVGNQGDGIWFDWKNKNNQIRENVAAYNTGFGIHYELSQSGVIQDNVIYGNGQRGIYLRDSANCWVTHNMVVANGLEGIAILYTGQKDGNGIEFGGEYNKVYSNIVGWNNGGALIMPKGASQLGESDANAYLGNQKSNKYSLGYPSTLSPAIYTLTDWFKVSSFDANSVASETAMPKEISDALEKKLTVKQWSAIQNMALTLKNESGRSVKNNFLPGGYVEEVGPRKLSGHKN